MKQVFNLLEHLRIAGCQCRLKPREPDIKFQHPLPAQPVTDSSQFCRRPHDLRRIMALLIALIAAVGLRPLGHASMQLMI